MAIVKMSKFDLLAFNSDRENLLHELQKFNYVHFLDLKEDVSLEDYDLNTVEVPESIVAIDEKIAKVRNTLEILSKYRKKESAFKTMQEGLETFEFTELEERALQIEYDTICNEILTLNRNIDELGQGIVKSNADISELSPWIKLDTPIKDLESFKQVELILGTIPRKLGQKVEDDLVTTEHTYYEVLSEDKDNLYVLVMTSKDENVLINGILQNSSFSNVKIGIEDEPAIEIAKIEDNIKSLKEKISENEIKLENYTEKLPDLQIVYEYLMNRKLRITSSENFLATDTINVIEGYIPTDMSEEFTEIVKKTLNNDCYIELKEAEKDDEEAPILLKNSKFARAFESLTGMYALPKYNEVDPTPFLAPFYSFFFGMMVADVGYGLMLLVCTFLVLKVFNLTETQKDTIRFFYYHSIFTILWGLIYGSFFSFSIPTGILDTGIQYNEILIIAIIFGIIHIYFALGINAYMSIRDGKPLDALFDVGFWYMALTGGILLLVSSVATLPANLAAISKYVMIIGMVGIVLTGGRQSSSIGGRLVSGLYSLYGISSYVGDFVSYSRLMALGLSGGFIASAINDMVGMLFDTGIIGIIFGIVVFVVGQLFNLFLSLLSAYVHSIRLTYVEFFGKFYEGGGTAFKTLRNKAKYISIK
ncbi:MAG: V-type ATP synthase subunit I [Tissierellia bacterium]|nr:V-type ATP synthase subunit I [Tissierellia bacterium]